MNSRLNKSCCLDLGKNSAQLQIELLYLVAKTAICYILSKEL